jgi:hypothetical protein
MTANESLWGGLCTCTSLPSWDVGLLLRHAHQYFKFASLVSFGRKTRNGLMAGN